MGADLYYEGIHMDAIRKASELSVMHWDLYKTISWVCQERCSGFIPGVDKYDEYENRTYIRKIDGETVFKETYWYFCSFWNMWLELSFWGSYNSNLIGLMDSGKNFTYDGKEYIRK